MKQFGRIKIAKLTLTCVRLDARKKLLDQVLFYFILFIADEGRAFVVIIYLFIALFFVIFLNLKQTFLIRNYAVLCLFHSAICAATNFQDPRSSEMDP